MGGVLDLDRVLGLGFGFSWVWVEVLGLGGSFGLVELWSSGSFGFGWELGEFWFVGTLV